MQIFVKNLDHPACHRRENRDSQLLIFEFDRGQLLNLQFTRVVRRTPVGKCRCPQIAVNLPETRRHASHSIKRIRAFPVVDAWCTQSSPFGKRTEVKRFVGEFDRHGFFYIPSLSMFDRSRLRALMHILGMSPLLSGPTSRRRLQPRLTLVRYIPRSSVSLRG